MCLFCLSLLGLARNFERLDVLVKFIDHLRLVKLSKIMLYIIYNVIIIYIYGIYIISLHVVKATEYRAKLVKLSVFLLSWKTGKYPGQKSNGNFCRC